MTICVDTTTVAQNTVYFIDMLLDKSIPKADKEELIKQWNEANKK